MLNTNNVVVFDLETGSVDTKTCEVLQIACVSIDARKMERIPNSEFNVYLKPISWDNVQAEALKVNNLTKEFIEKNGVNLKEGFAQFVNYLSKQNKGSGAYTAPIACGYNIDKFDLPIIQRLCSMFGNIDKEGNQNIFNRLFTQDLKNILWTWFENSKEPTNYKFDTFREHFGLTKEGAHNAIVDVKQTADVFIRFMQYQRKHAAKAKYFKDAFK